MANGIMRRRSIFGGLLLILIGVLFLLRSYMPYLGIGQLIAHYWPVLLIVWGLSKLYDYFAAQRSGQLQPAGISGGEVGLLILLFLVIGAFVTVDWVHKRNPNIEIGDWGILDRSATTTEELPAQTVKPGSTIAISVARGNINVHSVDTDQIHVMVTKTATASNDEEAQRLAQQVHMMITPVPGGYEVRQQPGGEESGSAKINLDIQVPKQANVTAKADHGDVHVADMDGTIAITAGNGDVEIHNAGGNVSAELQHGDVRISGVKGNARLTGHGSEVELSDITGDATIEGEFYGPIRERNVGKTARFNSSRTDLTILALTGHMEMNSRRLEISDVKGSLTLVTKDKDVSLENIAGRIQVEDRHGDIDLLFRQPPHAEVSITNDSGALNLTLPANSNFEIVASSRSGDIQSEFAELKPTQSGETSQLNGRVGSQGPQIHLATSYGTIHIKKGA